MVGLLTYPTLGEALVAPLAYLAIVTVEGHFLTPAFMGKRLELNPFAVFLSIAFCTWLWGPLGAFLAVPLLMALTVTLGSCLRPRRSPSSRNETNWRLARCHGGSSFSSTRKSHGTG